MKNKLIYRILGALASALIIVSVFVPFVSTTGYTTSLWDTFEITKSLYLPIMIIIFGAIGVIFFSLNVKTEFAYMSTGAIIFFIVMRTIDIINQGAFNTLSIGYYFLVIGAILTGAMAFLTNLKSRKQAEKEIIVEPPVETSMLDQIDRLYNDQSVVQDEISTIQPIDSSVEPLPIQPLQSVQSIESPLNKEIVSSEVQPIQNAQPISEPVVQVQESQQPIQVSQMAQVNELQQPTESQVASNPVVSEFSTESPVAPNPVVNEFAQETPVAPNPVVSEFSTESPVASNPVVNEFAQETPIAPNPVVNEFMTGTSISQNIAYEPNPQPMVQEQVSNVPEVATLENVNNINPVINDFNNTNSTADSKQSDGLDIFG